MRVILDTDVMTPQSLRLDERNHVEKPFLDQLAGLGWEILDLDNRQLPTDSHRENFTEVVMPPVLRERLRVINPWLENDQIDEVVKRLTASFPVAGLLENNRHVLNLLLENTSVSRNRQTGENSPTVHFVDFKNREKNRYIAVCQFKVRVPWNRAPHHSRFRVVCERPAGGSDRVQITQGEGRHPGSHRSASALQ